MSDLEIGMTATNDFQAKADIFEFFYCCGLLGGSDGDGTQCFSMFLSSFYNNIIKICFFFSEVQRKKSDDGFH